MEVPVGEHLRLNIYDSTMVDSQRCWQLSRWKYRWVNILDLIFMTPQWWIARGAGNCLDGSTVFFITIYIVFCLYIRALQTSLSQTGGYNLPPCHIVNLCGFHILFDCPLDLSALTIFSPISTGLYEKLDDQTFSSNLHPEIKKTSLLPAEPFYKTVERLHLWNVSLIDVVLISSPMGMLGLPFLTRAQGFSAKIYATEVTAKLGQLMMEDLVANHMEFKQFYGSRETSLFQLFKQETLPPALKEVVLGKDGTELGSWFPLYSAADVKDCLQKVESLKYAEEACYNGTLIIKALSSGLEIGSCNWNLKGPKRNISYISGSVFSSGTAMDFDFHALLGSDALIYSDFASWNGATCFEDENSSSIVPVDCSTKSDDAYMLNFDESSDEMEKLNFICSCSMSSVEAGGSVLIPIGRLGIILQLLELFALHIESSGIKVPIFMISSVAEELLAYTCIIPEWLCKERQEKLYSGKPVFAHEELIKEKKIHVFPTLGSHELLMIWQEPCIVVCPHWSLRLGPVVHLLHRWHGDPNALLVLEEGVDPDLALSPFKPVAMKVLECSFVSGIKLEKVPQLLKMLQPKLILLTLSKLKSKELTISRLKGKLFVDQGKHYLVADKIDDVLKDEAFDAVGGDCGTGAEVEGGGRELVVEGEEIWEVEGGGVDGQMGGLSLWEPLKYVQKVGAGVGDGEEVVGDVGRMID
ncbi:hypothetical protein E3N88_08276 [Mikania micrantha]|uniref:Beta-Casp domain-containing protein n=1 Tax=Mikania micrantha TaxID=192012 RepID=A0A5N6PHP7_9ASTR|nr:hypothetical protein E3N88_08276 [Mikania micrantha]